MTVTLDQVRAAVEKAVAKKRATDACVVDDVLAELTKPEIHPDVPVAWKCGGSLQVGLASLYRDFDSSFPDATRTEPTPLISVDEAQEIAQTAVAVAVKHGTVEAGFRRTCELFANYLKDGPDE